MVTQTAFKNALVGAQRNYEKLKEGDAENHVIYESLIASSHSESRFLL